MQEKGTVYPVPFVHPRPHRAPVVHPTRTLGGKPSIGYNGPLVKPILVGRLR